MSSRMGDSRFTWHTDVHAPRKANASASSSASSASTGMAHAAPLAFEPALSLSEASLWQPSTSDPTTSGSGSRYSPVPALAHHQHEREPPSYDALPTTSAATAATANAEAAYEADDADADTADTDNTTFAIDNSAGDYNYSKKGSGRRLPKACTNCRRSKVACSLDRPCARCCRKGLQDSCVDIPRKQRSRSSSSTLLLSSSSSSSSSSSPAALLEGAASYDYEYDGFSDDESAATPGSASSSAAMWYSAAQPLQAPYSPSHSSDSMAQQVHQGTMAPPPSLQHFTTHYQHQHQPQPQQPLPQQPQPLPADSSYAVDYRFYSPAPAQQQPPPFYHHQHHHDTSSPTSSSPLIGSSSGSHIYSSPSVQHQHQQQHQQQGGSGVYTAYQPSYGPTALTFTPTSHFQAQHHQQPQQPTELGTGYNLGAGAPVAPSASSSFDLIVPPTKRQAYELSSSSAAADNDDNVDSDNDGGSIGGSRLPRSSTTTTNKQPAVRLFWHQAGLQSESKIDIIAVYEETPSFVSRLRKCSSMFRAIAGLSSDETSKFSRVKHFVPERLRVLDEVFVAITRSGIFSHYRIIHPVTSSGSMVVLDTVLRLVPHPNDSASFDVVAISQFGSESSPFYTFLEARLRHEVDPGPLIAAYRARYADSHLFLSVLDSGIELALRTMNSNLLTYESPSPLMPGSSSAPPPPLPAAAPSLSSSSSSSSSSFGDDSSANDSNSTASDTPSSSALVRTRKRDRLGSYMPFGPATGDSGSGSGGATFANNSNSHTHPAFDPTSYTPPHYYNPPQPSNDGVYYSQQQQQQQQQHHSHDYQSDSPAASYGTMPLPTPLQTPPPMASPYSYSSYTGYPPLQCPPYPPAQQQYHQEQQQQQQQQQYHHHYQLEQQHQHQYSPMYAGVPPPGPEYSASVVPSYAHHVQQQYQSETGMSRSHSPPPPPPPSTVPESGFVLQPPGGVHPSSVYLPLGEQR